MVLLSAWGTLRVILILVIVWQVLRIIMRMQMERQGGGVPGQQRPPARPKGEVRIERLDRPTDHDRPSQGPVQDVDFEEIR